MSYYFAIVGTQDNPLFEYEFGTSKQGGDGQSRFAEQVRHLNQFILHSSLDIAEEVQWSHGQMSVFNASLSLSHFVSFEQLGLTGLVYTGISSASTSSSTTTSPASSPPATSSSSSSISPSSQHRGAHRDHQRPSAQTLRVRRQRRPSSYSLQRSTRTGSRR